MIPALRRAAPAPSPVEPEATPGDDVAARHGWGRYWSGRGRETLITDDAGRVIVRVISLGGSKPQRPDRTARGAR
jgi:hypothetical protein